MSVSKIFMVPAYRCRNCDVTNMCEMEVMELNEEQREKAQRNLGYPMPTTQAISVSNFQTCINCDAINLVEVDEE